MKKNRMGLALLVMLAMAGCGNNGAPDAGTGLSGMPIETQNISEASATQEAEAGNAKAGTTEAGNAEVGNADKERTTAENGNAEGESTKAENASGENTKSGNAEAGNIEGEGTKAEAGNAEAGSTKAGNTKDGNAKGADAIELSDDLWVNYSDQIKHQVENAVRDSSSLADELAAVKAIADRYDDLGERCQTQAEMTQVSKWAYVVWDTELNGLWQRMSGELEASTKEEVLSEQRRWVNLKETAAELATMDMEGGSLRPQIINIDAAEYTMNRCYKLAGIYAASKGESIALPQREVYGVYIDDEGTGEEYGEIVVNRGMEKGTANILISLYRMGQLTGVGEIHGNEIDFVSDEGNVKGTISCTPDGASFIVSEADASFVSAGEFYDFELAF